MKQYKLIKMPEEGYYVEDHGTYKYTSKDWWIGIKAEQINLSSYYVQTGQCEPFLTAEEVEARPDLWEEIDES